MTKDEIISTIIDIIVDEHDIKKEDLSPETNILDLGIEIPAIAFKLYKKGFDNKVLAHACMEQSISRIAAVLAGEDVDEQVENNDHIDERRMYGAIKQSLLKWSKKRGNKLLKQLVIYNMDGTFNLYINPGLKDEYDLHTGTEYLAICCMDMNDEEQIDHVYKLGYKKKKKIEKDFPLKDKIDLDENFKVYTMEHDNEELRDDLRKKANNLLSSSYEVFCEKF